MKKIKNITQAEKFLYLELFHRLTTLYSMNIISHNEYKKLSKRIEKKYGWMEPDNMPF